MAIKRDVKVVISGETSKVDELIYVYQNDRGIDLYFDIVENKFTFSGEQSESIIRTREELMYASITIKKPDGTGMYRPILPIADNRVLFRIEHEHTDEFSEIGTYQLQIHLFDKFDNRVTIPPFNLEVKPLIITDFDNMEKTAIVGYSVVDKSTVGEEEKQERVLFYIKTEGNVRYLRTVWQTGDVITADKLNNLEVGVEAISLNLANLEIPNIEGLATEEFVKEAIAEGKIDLESYKEEVAELEEKVDVATEEVDALNRRLDEFDEKLESANGELETTKESAIQAIEQAKDNALEGIEQVKQELDVVVTEGATVKEGLEGAIDNANTAKTELEDTIENANTVKSELEETIENANTAKEGLATEIENAKTEIDSKIEEALQEIEEDKESIIGRAEEALQEAVDEIMEEGKKNLRDRASELSEQLIKTGLDEVKKVTDVASEQKGLIEALTGDKLTEISEAGAEIVEMVEGLEANINDGLAQINSTINQGKTDINKLGGDYLTEIAEAGKEIVDAVANLEAITDEHIENINNAGERNLNSLERATASHKADISSHSNEQKGYITELAQGKIDAINNAGQAKLDEINGLVGTTEEEVAELLRQTRNEITDFRSDINSTLTNGRTEINNIKNSATTEINRIKEEALEEARDIEVTLNTTKEQYKADIVATGNATKEQLNAKVEQINALQERINANLQSSNESANRLIENLQNNLSNASTKIRDEINPVLSQLDDFARVCNELKAENEQAKANIPVLDELYDNSLYTIVRLEELIADAEGLEGVGQDFTDLKNKVNALEASIEELKGLNAKFEDYYTKEETDLLVETLDAKFEEYATKEEVATSIEDAVGAIEIPSIEGLATEEYVEEAIAGINIPSTDHLATKEELENALENIEIPNLDTLATKEYVDNALAEFEIPTGSGLSVIGEFDAPIKKFKLPDQFKYVENFTEAELGRLSSEPKHFVKFDRYYSSNIHYTHAIICGDMNDTSDGKYAYLKDNTIYFNKLVMNNDYVAKSTTGNGSNSASLVNLSLTNVQQAIYDFDFDIFNEDGTEVLIKYVEPPQGYTNFDDAKEDGYYLIDLEYDKFTKIDNAPTIKKLENVKGNLCVIDEVQTLTLTSGDIFTREIGGEWINPTSSLHKEDFNGIIGESVGSKTPSLFKNIPPFKFELCPNKAEIFVRTSENEYAVVRIANHNLDGAKGYTDATYLYPNCKENATQYDIYNTTTKTWRTYNYSSYSSSNFKLYINTKYFTIYKTDMPIYAGSAYTNLRSDVCEANYDLQETIQDFNQATELGLYKIDFKDAGVILNAPISEASTGSMEVINTGSFVKQIVNLADNRVLERTLVGEAWTQWVEASDFYNKKETDGKLADLKGSLGGYNGEIGVSMLNEMPEGLLDGVPEPVPYTGTTYMGKIVHEDVSNKRYHVTYVFNNPEYDTFAYNNSNSYNKDFPLSVNYLSTVYKTFKGYYRSTTSSTWNTSSTPSLPYITRRNFHLYECELPIYSDKDKTEIQVKPTNTNFINDLNLANQNGYYNVEVDAEQYKKLLNAPKIELKDKLATTLNVTENSVGEKIQEISIEGVTFTRKLGQEWTYNDTFFPKKMVSKIKEKEELPEVFETCPVPDHMAIRTGDCSVMDLKWGNYYYRFYQWVKDNMFYRYNSSATSVFVGVTGSSGFAVYRCMDDGAWAEYTTNYRYINGNPSQLTIYRHTAPICNGTGTEKFDTNTIIAQPKEIEGTIQDFNQATVTGAYEYFASSSILNKPCNSNGTLEVIANSNHVVQKLTTANGDYYSRVKNGDNWTEWKSNIEDAGIIGKIEATKFDTYPLTTQPTNPNAETYKWKLQYRDTSNYGWTLFFKKDPTNFIKADYSSGGLKLLIDTNNLTMDDSSRYRTNSSFTSWSSNSTYPPYGMSSSMNYTIKEIYYHNFDILDKDGNIDRYNIEENYYRGYVEDFNDATTKEKYIVSCNNVANTPVGAEGSGVLVNEFIKDKIKQTLTLDDGTEYSRMFNTEWTEWKSVQGYLDELKNILGTFQSSLVETTNQILDMI